MVAQYLPIGESSTNLFWAEMVEIRKSHLMICWKSNLDCFDDGAI
jgi:hypothetical protein